MRRETRPLPETVTVSADGATLDLESVLTGRGFVTGKSGSGKSNTASVLAEELLALGLPLLLVDADGEYHGLDDAFEVLHVGGDERCDATVDPEDAERIATAALDDGVPVRLDLSGFPSEDAGRAVFEALLDALFRLEGDRRVPFPVFVEEVHEYVPQQGGLDDLGDLLVRVAKRGRKRGLGVCGLSQRPAAVDKEFVTQCDWFAWHRLTWESDVAVLERFLDAERAAEVADLEAGEAILVTDWDGAVRRVQFRRAQTATGGATPTLERARRRAGGSSAREVAAAVAGEEVPDLDGDEAQDAPGSDPPDLGPRPPPEPDPPTPEPSTQAPPEPAAGFVGEAAALLAHLVRSAGRRTAAAGRHAAAVLRRGALAVRDRTAALLRAL